MVVPKSFFSLSFAVISGKISERTIWMFRIWRRWASRSVGMLLLRARHWEEGKRYRVLGGVSILESPICPEWTNLKSARSAKFWSNVATNMQYTPRFRPFGQSSRSKIWNSPLESCSFWAQKYANSPLTFGGASQGLDEAKVTVGILYICHRQYIKWMDRLPERENKHIGTLNDKKWHLMHKIALRAPLALAGF